MGQTVARIREGMMGRGFALVATPRYFGDRLPRLRQRRTVLSPSDPRWRKLPQLARYACWLEELLAAALPEEAVFLKSLEHRHEPAGAEDEEVDRLHADGSYIRAVTTLYGPTTVYRDRGVERPVPDGHTLVMTAMDRARAVRRPCTLHRRPGAGPERALIVCSFEPCSDAAARECLYREAAEASAAGSR